MPTCEINELLQSAACNETGGIVEVYIGKVSEINKATTTADFTAATWTLTDITTSGVFSVAEADQTTSAFEQKFSEADKSWTQTATINIVGVDATLVAATQKIAYCCDLALICVYADGRKVLVGLDYSTGLGLASRPLEKGKFTEITDASNQRNGKHTMSFTYVVKTKEPAITYTGTIPD